MKILSEDLREISLFGRSSMKISLISSKRFDNISSKDFSFGYKVTVMVTVTLIVNDGQWSNGNGFQHGDGKCNDTFKAKLNTLIYCKHIL